MKSTCSLYKIFAGINAIKKSKDFITLEIASNKSSIVISYFRTLIDVNIFHEEVLTYIKEKSLIHYKIFGLSYPLKIQK